MLGKPRLGELLIEEKLVSQDVIDTALRIQTCTNRRIGHILVRMKAISADQLAETLQKQLAVPIIDIEEHFTAEVKSVLPRYLCRQYDVLPLRIKDNNILEMAMSNPADSEAINSLEQYTGRVIEPLLARHSDIAKEIGRRIPLGPRDFFTPQATVLTTRIVAATAFLLVLALGFFTFDYIQKNRYGTVSATDNHVLYKHHDLILGIEKSGKISLLGRGAFSQGFYSISFDNADNLKAFVQSRTADFSEPQYSWLMWAMEQTAFQKFSGNLAASN